MNMKSIITILTEFVTRSSILIFRAKNKANTNDMFKE